MNVSGQPFVVSIVLWRKVPCFLADYATCFCRLCHVFADYAEFCRLCRVWRKVPRYAWMCSGFDGEDEACAFGEFGI